MGHGQQLSLYTILLARRIPALYEAIMNELAQVPGVNLPPTRTAALGGPATGDASMRSLFAGSASPLSSPGDRDGPQLNSTLAELAVTQASQWVVDKVIEDFNAKYKAGKQFATDIMTQAFSGAAIVAAVSHIRQFVQGQDTGTIVSGASLSFRVFEAPYSFIEGPWDLQDPEMNPVFIIGPSIVDDVQPFITKFKDAMKFRQTLNPLAEDGKYKSAKEIKRDLKDFKTALEDLKQGAQDLVETITNIEQTPTGVDRPCIFDADPNCGQLLFDVGFRSVYKYRPPPGFESFTGLPLPIILHRLQLPQQHDVLQHAAVPADARAAAALSESHPHARTRIVNDQSVESAQQIHPEQDCWPARPAPGVEHGQVGVKQRLRRQVHGTERQARGLDLFRGDRKAARPTDDGRLAARTRRVQTEGPAQRRVADGSLRARIQNRLDPHGTRTAATLHQDGASHAEQVRESAGSR